MEHPEIHPSQITRSQITIDGSEAVASVAFKASEVIAIYPITPSSGMGELADQWASEGKTNLWGSRPTVIEMQSEGGAAGALHGALQTGSLCTTFTASQGLLLMIPNMYKIAGELTPVVFHVAARSLAAQGLSIFGDHGDVMAARATGWAMLFAGSVQEAHDLSLIAHAATLEARVPFLHVLDGFRTTHEVAKIEALEPNDIRAMIDDNLVRQHRARGLTPDHPAIRGTAQNPDVYFQARETVNPYYEAVPEIVTRTMDRFTVLTGRHYRPFDYAGAPDAQRVIVIMGSGGETVEETVKHLVSSGEKVGVVRVRLYRPFSVKHFLESLPASVKSIAVLDRTKEPGSAGEPLYQDVVTAVLEGFTGGQLQTVPRVIGGRYGLASKEFTPAMVRAVFTELEKLQPKNHFTLGINDDVSHSSLEYDPSFTLEPKDEVRAVFYGLGSDGTVGANKNSIKIIGEETDLHAQGYFVYDSKKSGSRTVSHLRFGPQPIRAPYLIQGANFIAIHQWNFLERIEMLREAQPGASLLLNSPFAPDAVWKELPKPVQQTILEKKLHLHVIDGDRVALEAGMGGRVNTVMQTCFFALSGVLPRDEAISKIKDAIRKTYGKRGEAVVQQNFAAVDSTLEHLYEVKIPETGSSQRELVPAVPSGAPDFVRNVLGEMIAGRGDALPVSAMPVDGTYPSGTSRYEKRGIADAVPVWESELCIQCGKCVLVCPHAVIRAKVIEATSLADAPAGFRSANAMWKELPDHKYTLQVSSQDCTGCTLCVEVCPAKDKSNVSRKAINMVDVRDLPESELSHWDYFLKLPEILEQAQPTPLHFTNVKNVQLLEPLFEFSGACAGCGETPYLKLLTQLFGDRAVVANATGCSSIYGGNLPTTPWSLNSKGRGPAWSNSLFEDNAEYGLGMRLTLDKQREYASELVSKLRGQIGKELAQAILAADQSNLEGIEAQRERIVELKKILSGMDSPEARDLSSLADALVQKSVWIVGGDGWAYDIGSGGLDHILASGANVNVLVLDTEVYSNTGGQASKSTPLGAVAKFASSGKTRPRKNLGQLAIDHGRVYVAQIAMGGSDAQTVKAFLEAEAYPGVSIILAYSHCIAHGIDMTKGMNQQKLAVNSGHWPLYRYDPRLEHSMQLDSKAPSVPLREYRMNEMRFRVLTQSHPAEAEAFLHEAELEVRHRWRELERLAAISEPRETPVSADD
jgi:pyruvate-ferredoxin/flavodoxin oxidoreductase